MKALRIQADRDGSTFFLDVVCDCGHNGLKNEVSGVSSFHHKIELGEWPDKMLTCDCGKRYRIHPQETHIHVSNIFKT